MHACLDGNSRATLLRTHATGGLPQIFGQDHLDPQANQTVLVAIQIPSRRDRLSERQKLLSCPAVRQPSEASTRGPVPCELGDMGVHHLQFLESGALKLRPGHGQRPDSPPALPGVWNQASLDPRAEGCHKQCDEQAISGVAPAGTPSRHVGRQWAGRRE